MSWCCEPRWIVSGKIYHCTNCGCSFQIEYEGGAGPTPENEDIFEQQWGLDTEFGQPNANPYVEGTYLHEKIICEECFPTAKNDEAVAKQLIHLAGLVRGSTRAIAKTIRPVCSTLTVEDLKIYLGECVFKDLTSSYISPARKQRLLRQIFHTGRSADQYFTHLIRPELAKMEKPRADTRLKEFANQLKVDYLTALVPQRIWDENKSGLFKKYINVTNPHRKPEFNTPQRNFYQIATINLDEFKYADITRIALDYLDDKGIIIRDHFKKKAESNFLSIPESGNQI
jgi:hypothetical protein